MQAFRLGDRNRFGAGRIELVTSIDRDEVNMNMRDGEPFNGDADPFGGCD